jgi:hypothetical protein
MERKKGSIGALFPNTKKKNPKAPALLGTLRLDSQLFDALINVYEDQGDVSIQVSAWINIANDTGKQYLTLKAQLPWDLRRRDDPDEGFRFLADLD